MNKDNPILQYIYSQRWCSFKNEITNDSIEDIQFFDTEFDNSEKVFVMGKVIFKNGDDEFFIMPLSKGTMEAEVPFKYNNVDVYDAVKSPNYWSSIMKEITLDKSLNIANQYNLVYRSWDDFDFITNHINDKSYPLNVEQSNSTIIVGEKVLAFKQQRMIEFLDDADVEVEMNYNLMKAGSTAVPKTYGHLSLIAPDGKSAFIGIVQEFVHNNGDLWAIAKEQLLKILSGAFENGEKRIKKAEYKDITKLMKNLGKKTEELIKCLLSFNGNDLTPEKIGDEYLQHYKSTIVDLLKETKENIIKNIDKLSSDMALEIQNPIIKADNIEKFIIDSFGKIEVREDKGLLMRVHGDFHLGQAIQTDTGDIKFIDFAGEPNLAPSERKTKHSYMYDVAGMYRSISGYLPIVVSKHFATDENGKIDNEKLLWANDVIKPIIKNLADAFIGELNIDNEWLTIEIFRRNLYEVNYEIAYRPQMLFIPINNLKELILNNK